MNGNLKNKLVQLGFVIVGLSMMTACHTVEGTVHGAGQDMQSVANTVNPPEHHYRHHHVKHTKSMPKKNMSDQSTSTKDTSTQTEQKTSNSSTN